LGAAVKAAKVAHRLYKTAKKANKVARSAAKSSAWKTLGLAMLFTLEDCLECFGIDNLVKEALEADEKAAEKAADKGA
jgi:hypothetical protein